MKEATAFANKLSAKENDDALAEIKKTGKTEMITLTPQKMPPCRRRWSRSTRTWPAASASS